MDISIHSRFQQTTCVINIAAVQGTIPLYLNIRKKTWLNKNDNYIPS
jgi:hypothetical protein